MALAGIRALLIDLDGVIYRGETPLPGANELVPALDELGIDHVFVTNNSTLTVEQVATKLTSMSVATSANHVMTSALATADYLRTVEAPGGRVLAIGEEGICSALTAAGFLLVDEHPSCVVIGLDRGLTYARLAQACIAIRAGARFVATNVDPALPVEGGFWPGTGAIVAAVRTSTNVDPFVVGKPAPTLLQMAMARIGATPEATAMVGDQAASDIRAGHAAGTATILVGTDPIGSRTGELGDSDPEAKPDVQVADLYDLVKTLRYGR